MNIKSLSFYSLIIISLISSCTTTKNYLKIENDNVIKEMFERNQVNSKYNYFLYGDKNIPEAIMGIDKSYKIDTKFWKPIDLKSEHLETWSTAYIKEKNSFNIDRIYFVLLEWFCSTQKCKNYYRFFS